MPTSSESHPQAFLRKPASIDIYVILQQQPAIRVISFAVVLYRVS